MDPSNSDGGPRDFPDIDGERRVGVCDKRVFQRWTLNGAIGEEIREQDMVKNPLKRRAMGECFFWAALTEEGGMVYGKPWWQDEKNAGDQLIAYNSLKCIDHE